MEGLSNYCIQLIMKIPITFVKFKRRRKFNVLNYQGSFFSSLIVDPNQLMKESFRKIKKQKNQNQNKGRVSCLISTPHKKNCCKFGALLICNYSTPSYSMQKLYNKTLN